MQQTWLRYTFQIIVCLTLLLGIAFAIFNLRYLTVFIPELSTTPWFYLIESSAFDITRDSAQLHLINDYQHLSFVMHVLLGSIYLLLTPYIFYKSKQMSYSKGVLNWIILISSVLIIIWPIHFLFKINVVYDVSFFIIFSITFIWLILLIIMFKHLIQCNTSGFIFYLKMHYCISLGAALFRLIYWIFTIILDMDTIILTRDAFSMVYHNSWFLSLILSVIMLKVCLLMCNKKAV
ncbi:MAG: hypothetical protein HRU38_20085 [Saccharospirillaceae bacterium]|nr:hypothetical protein [Pseudomonadales bacterium]NRB80932.1 hypothetical protein [Saccharospirillaceae bacterium]